MKRRTKKQDDPELTALVRLRDEDIDTSDIPEVKDWANATSGKFYRPLKEPITLRLDLDVVAWLKSDGPGYQTRINTLLRTAMTTSAPDPKVGKAVRSCRNLRFPILERQGALNKYCHVAELIEERGFFAPVS
jgi:uncharacterized protein (DUF4415 family)